MASTSAKNAHMKKHFYNGANKFTNIVEKIWKLISHREINRKWMNFAVSDQETFSSLYKVIAIGPKTKLEKIKLYPSKLLIITQQHRFEEIANFMENSTNIYTNRLTIAKQTPQKIILYQPIKLTNVSNTIWNVYGEWTKGSGLALTSHPTRLNFHGSKFKIALVLEDEKSEEHLKDFRHPNVDVYTKQNLGAIASALEFCNITYEFIRVPNYRHLFQQDYDFLFTGSAPYMTKSLVSRLDFVRIQNSPKVCYLLKRPPTSYVTTIFTVAFESSVWYAVLICLLLLSIALFAILNIEGRREPIKFKEKFNPMDLALIALEAVCQQGTSTDPKSYSGRILEVIMFTAFMFLYVSYSANILVLLQSTTHISTTQEMNELNIKIGGMDTSSFLQYHENEIGNELFGTNINSSRVYTIAEGMEKVRQGLFAYFHENQYGYNYVKEAYTDYEVCGLQELAGSFQMNFGYVAMPKGSPYKEILKIAFLKMDELGLQRRHYSRYFLKPQCYSKGSSFDAVGIAETYQAMLLVILGVFAGLLVLAGELLLFRFKNKKLQN